MMHGCRGVGEHLVQTHVTQAGPDRALIVASGSPQAPSRSSAAQAYERIAEILHRRQMQIVQERIFGSISEQPAVLQGRAEGLRSRGLAVDGPLTWVQGHPVWGAGLAGIIIHAIRPAPGEFVRILADDGGPVGRAWQVEGARYAILQNLQGLAGEARADDSPAAQARRTIERAERALASCGMCYAHTVRTWFYLSHIVDWYPEFNRVRNEKYQELGLLPVSPGADNLLPASTGIGGELSGTAACAMDLIAIAPSAAGHPAVKRISNRRQQEAFCYGSAFARGAVLGEDSHALLQVSGTAAIDEAGRSLFAGDVRAQVRSTLERLADLLSPEGLALPDISAATLFVKHPEDADRVREVLAEAGLEQFPAVFVVADVCRPELLFEIDAEAIVLR